MKQITKKVTEAFLEGRALRISNTETDGTSLWLHGNKIAEINNNGVLKISDGRYGVSRTTAERLNALPNVRVNIKQGCWLLNGEDWDGSWTTIQKVRYGG